MRVPNRSLRWLAALAMLALIAAGCGGGEDPAEGGGEASGGASEPTSEAGSEAAEGSGGEFSVYIGEPESLFPQNTNETNGAEVLNALFSGLVDYDVETAQPMLADESPRAMAESIESDDQQTWTITIVDGWTFHDGTPVTAQSYVDAWNFAAYGPNAQGNSYFFDNIEGSAELKCAENQLDAEGLCKPNAEPAAEEMSGLEVIDDTTFEVTLTAPFSQFPLTVGYTAFYPLPEVAIEDPDAYNEAPVGNGPFMMDGEWQHNQQINVVRYPDYAGEPAQADAVEFRIYAEPDTAYNDLLAGDLDILEDVPAAQIESARAEFGEAFLEGESSSFTYIGFPLYEDAFEDANLRRAFSMAIDREAITRTIRTDAVPADAMVSPVVAGYREGACGEACTFDPEMAQQLYDEAGGYDGELTLWFNTGGDHEAWMEAVSNQLRENLGIESIRFRSLDFAEYLGLLDNEEVTGPFRLGWVMDYPSPQNYLEPIHASNGSSNNTGYSNEEFDELVAEGNAAGSIEEGLDAYARAEDVLIEDLPIIPMFFGRVAGAHSERVQGVTIDAFTRLNTADVTVTE